MGRVLSESCNKHQPSNFTFKKIGRLPLLENLFEQILVPRAVIKEIEAKPGVYEQEVATLIRANILEIQACEETISHEHLADLGDGERETISLALETSAD